MAPEVKTAGREDVDRVLDAIVLGFVQDPTLRWIYPEPHEYLTGFRGFLPFFGGQAFDTETAFYVEGFTGASLWLPPGVHPDEEAIGEHVQSTVALERVETVFGMFEAMDSYHPDEPCWYLPVIGVDPGHQRRGIGTALLHHALKRVDEEKLPAYLESSNPENVPLYERHGFEAMGTIQIGDAPMITPMLRRPM